MTVANPGLIADLASRIAPLHVDAMAAARARQAVLTKPAGSLGRLEELAVQLAGMQAKTLPSVESALVVVAAGDHGVAAQGVSAFPQAVTGQMVANFLAGGAAISALSAQAGAKLVVLDAGTLSDVPEQPGLRVRRVRAGTRDFTQEPALTPDEVLAAIATGVETFEEESAGGVDVVALGEMGIANTTAAAAMVAAFTGSDPALVTGYGTGVDQATWEHKVGVIQSALDLHRPDSADAMAVLSAVGGLEICALVGVTLAAAANRTPVIVDGYITTAAALAAVTLAPAAREYLVAAHRSVEPGHRIALQQLALEPLLDLGMRLGEGSGAALAIHILRAATRTHAQMATFDSAGVSEKS